MPPPPDSYTNAAVPEGQSKGVAVHDNGYKLLFSHAEMVADLLREFVGKTGQNVAAALASVTWERIVLPEDQSFSEKCEPA